MRRYYYKSSTWLLTVSLDARYVYLIGLIITTNQCNVNPPTLLSNRRASRYCRLIRGHNNGYANSQLQQIDGFGFSQAFGRANELKNAGSTLQKQALDYLFSTTTGAGFSIIRNRIGSGGSGDSIEPTSPGSPGLPRNTAGITMIAARCGSPSRLFPMV